MCDAPSLRRCRRATALLPRFWSGEAVTGAEAIDAFAQSWAGEHLLVHAPVGLLLDVIEKLEREKEASAVVVCPYWTGGNPNLTPTLNPALTL